MDISTSLNEDLLNMLKIYDKVSVEYRHGAVFSS
jgi:hypothetical protein